ncbi:MAG: hypothetical protein KGO02_03540 [Alphaproteobacteria bacterium]|nr:hypothetical protein [Alphaproteobacteria bacterium]
MIRLRRLAPIVLSIGGALALSSCASLNPFATSRPVVAAPRPLVVRPHPQPPASAIPAPTPRPYYVAPAPQPYLHPAPAEARSARPRKTMVEPQSLIGLRRGQVARQLGQPHGIAKDGPGLVWRYVAAGCGLNVYFFPDLKTNEFHVLKFSLEGPDGKALDINAPCRRQLLALKDQNAG